MVSKQPAGALGVPAGRARVKSQRSATEKAPWKDLPALEGVVETEFVRPVYLGESILPFRAMNPALGVIPWDTRGLLSPGTDAIEQYPGLATWMREADALWQANRSSERLSLIERLDYHRELSRQFPTQAQRVVYTKSGMHLAAARIVNRRAVIDHKLYWATVVDDEEASYLCAILNASKITQLVRPLMSYGKDERDIDKHVWKLPIPEYDRTTALHCELGRLGREAEQAVASLQLRAVHFATQRRQVREFLADAGHSAAIDAAVERLLGA
jgi:hypothetical protein